MIIGHPQRLRPAASSLVAPQSKPYYCLYPSPKMFLYQTQTPIRARARVFPTLSLSQTQQSINNQSPLLLFRQQLQFLCLSAFPPPNSQIINNNNKSRFLSLAPANSYYHDEFHVKHQQKGENEEEEEEEGKASSMVAVKIPSYVKLMTGLGLKGQFLCVLANACIFAYFLLFTGLIVSPATFCATAGGVISAYISLYLDFNMRKYLHMVEEQKHIANDPLKTLLRVDIMKHIKYAIPVNLFGIGLTILGMQGRFGLDTWSFYYRFPYNNHIEDSLVEGCRTSLVQGSKGTIICHLLGLASSLVLLRWVTTPPSKSTKTKFCPAFDPDHPMEKGGPKILD